MRKLLRTAIFRLTEAFIFIIKLPADGADDCEYDYLEPGFEPSEKSLLISSTVLKEVVCFSFILDCGPCSRATIFTNRLENKRGHQH